MSRYNPAMKQQLPRSEGPHPIWRGLGCAISVIVPVISYAGAALLIEAGGALGWPIPYQLMGRPVITPLLWKITSLAPLWAFIQSQNNLYAILSLAILLTIILEAFISISYALMYRSAVPRYRPLDVPRPDIKVKRYKR